jgi:dipeptidyl aminopeptidase/acylaminoacyl peptidase
VDDVNSAQESNMDMPSRRQRFSFLLLTPMAALALGPESAASQDAPPTLDVGMYLEWEDVATPQLSPDGRRILYERRWVDRMNDRMDSSIWIIEADGTRNRQLVRGSSPSWSPDGSRIAYLAQDSGGGTQVFVRWMDEEGATSQVTRLTQRPSGVRWSPDGERLAFQMLVPSELDSSWRIPMPDRPAGANWTEPSRVEDRLVYKQDRVGWLPRGHEHLFVVSADGGTPRQVTTGDYDHGDFAWSPDGRSLLFSGLRVPEAEYEVGHREIYRIAVESGEVEQLTDLPGPHQNPVPSPDGRLIAFQGHEWTRAPYWENELYVMDADGGNVRRLAGELGSSLGNLTWAPDGSGLYLNASILGTQNLWFVPLQGEAQAVTEGQHMLNVSDLGRDGTAVATRSGPHEPRSLISFNVRRPAEVAVLHSTNRDLLTGVRLGEVEEIWYPSVDGLDIHGWIVKPPDFDASRKYPLVLRIHGGPHSMYHIGFDFKNQDHAANGYVVLYTNPRGSSGYGTDFGNEIQFAYPSLDYDDLMVGVDTLLARGYIDERNLFVYGGSGGGVLTSWIVGHTDRFTAAVAKAPVINFMSFCGNVDGNPIRWCAGGRFEDYFWDDPSGHLERSPIMHVGNVSTPTMLMTGSRDLRTPMSQTEEYYRALKIRRVPTAMVQLTDGWHSRDDPPTNFIRVQVYLRNWFERFMVPGDPVAASRDPDPERR